MREDLLEHHVVLDEFAGVALEVLLGVEHDEVAVVGAVAPAQLGHAVHGGKFKVLGFGDEVDGLGGARLFRLCFGTGRE